MAHVPGGHRATTCPPSWTSSGGQLAALAHVFPAERYPFPADDVLARWRLVLDEPPPSTCSSPTTPTTRDGLVAYAAYDDYTLRHLAVRPDHWGRGLATAAIETVLHAMDLRGSTIASLWVLQENHRARRLYEYLGWRPDRRGARRPGRRTRWRWATPGSSCSPSADRGLRH